MSEIKPSKVTSESGGRLKKWGCFIIKINECVGFESEVIISLHCVTSFMAQPYEFQSISYILQRKYMQKFYL